MSRIDVGVSVALIVIGVCVCYVAFGGRVVLEPVVRPVPDPAPAPVPAPSPAPIVPEPIAEEAVTP